MVFPVVAGQFYQGVNFEVSDLFPGKDFDKQDAIMFVKGNKLTVTRWMQKHTVVNSQFQIMLTTYHVNSVHVKTPDFHWICHMIFFLPGAGKEISGRMWRMVKMCHVGSFIIMALDFLMEFTQTTLCLVSTKPSEKHPCLKLLQYTQ